MAATGTALWPDLGLHVASQPPFGRRLVTFALAYALGYLCCCWGWSQVERGHRGRAGLLFLLAGVLTIPSTWLFLITGASWSWDWWW